MGAPPGHRLPAAEAAVVTAAGAERVTRPLHLLAQNDRAALRMPPVTLGHAASVRLLEQSLAVTETRHLYREALGHDVYFRPTSAGLTVLALDPSASAMVGVGLLKQLLPSRALLEGHLAEYRRKRSRMTRASAEEQLSLRYVAAALGNGLSLPIAPELIFVCQEWAFPLQPNGSRKLDLLALDVRSSRLVVVELKSTVGSRGRGGSPDEQAREYARFLYEGRQFFTPFFERLCAAMAAAYAGPVQMQGLVLEDAEVPETIVLHADEEGRQ